MFYIHQHSCISPQQTFPVSRIDDLFDPVDKKLQVIEPSYEQIPPGMLRRMGKAVRIGVGAALPLLSHIPVPDGIILGTANAGKEDCVKFLNQIIEYNEGMLTPLNFVQGTPNAIASQVGILTKNHGYNITHMHLGLAFENVLTDADMQIAENPTAQYLVDAVDNISVYNYYFEDKGGWYKKETVTGKQLYDSGTNGSVAGEAAAMFIVNGNPAGASAKLLAVNSLHHADAEVMKHYLRQFIENNLPDGEKIDLLLSGENGDNRLRGFYEAAEEISGRETAVARFKHMSGEFPTATAMGLWLCCRFLQGDEIPVHMIKSGKPENGLRNILIYNNYKGIQNSFILVALP